MKCDEVMSLFQDKLSKHFCNGEKTCVADFDFGCEVGGSVSSGRKRLAVRFTVLLSVRPEETLSYQRYRRGYQRCSECGYKTSDHKLREITEEEAMENIDFSIAEIERRIT